MFVTGKWKRKKKFQDEKHGKEQIRSEERRVGKEC